MFLFSPLSIPARLYSNFGHSEYSFNWCLSVFGTVVFDFVVILACNKSELNILLGIDPLDFLGLWRSKRINTFQEYFAQVEPVVTVRIATLRTPDFVLRYPSLMTKELPLAPVAGWEIKFNWTGVPIAWTPLTVAETVGLPREQARVINVNAEVERRQRSKTLVVSRRGSWVVGKDLETVLQQLFGVR